MADESAKTPTAVRMLHASPLESAKVKVTKDNTLQVEFNVEDLVKRLMPGGLVASSCGGCNGCSGCSM